MIDKKISIRYARALLKLCEDKGIDDEVVLADLKDIVNVLYSNEMLYNYLVAEVVDYRNKVKIIEELSNNKDVVDFLTYVVKKRRFRLIFDIVQLFEDFVYDKHNRVKAYVKSAVELSDIVKNELKEKFTRILKKEIEFDFSVDETLIGGIVVQVKDIVYDGSVKTYLVNLKQRLLKLPV